MPRPQIQVTLAAASPRGRVLTETGTAFVVYASATVPPSQTGGANTARRFTNPARATADLPETLGQYVASVFAQGAAEVYVARVDAADASAVTQSQWGGALNQFVSAFGAGQVLVPGVATDAAHQALLAHSAQTGRCALLDSVAEPTADELSDLHDALGGNAGARRAGLTAPWVNLTLAGEAITVPGSVLAAGLAARMDARAGNAGRLPAGTQEFTDAGLVYGGTSTTVEFTDDELDTLSEAGVSPFIARPGGVYLYDWLSLAGAEVDQGAWTQLNAGRLAMQITIGTSTLLEQFLFRTIDGRGQLFAEVEASLEGYLLSLYQAGALYGEEASDAFSVDVAGVTTEEDVTNGVLRAAVSVAFSRGARQLTFIISVQRPGEVSA